MAPFSFGRLMVTLRLSHFAAKRVQLIKKGAEDAVAEDVHCEDIHNRDQEYNDPKYGICRHLWRKLAST